MLLAQRQNRENDSVAITLFERIVALDPSFAAAQAGLARAYALRVSEFAPEDTAALKQAQVAARSEEHTSELQSPCNLVCRLLLEKKKTSAANAIQRGIGSCGLH